MRWWNVVPVLLLQFVLVSRSWAENYILAPYNTEIKSLQNQRVAHLGVLPASNGGWELFFDFRGEVATVVDMCSSVDVSIAIDPQVEPGGVVVAVDRIMIRGGLLASMVVDGSVILKVSDAENRDKLHHYIYNQSFQYWKNDRELYLLERKCRRLFSGGILFSKKYLTEILVVRLRIVEYIRRYTVV